MHPNVPRVKDYNADAYHEFQGVVDPQEKETRENCQRAGFCHLLEKDKPMTCGNIERRIIEMGNFM